MKRLIKQKKGQFVIIAMLMIAIMIISIAALIHRAVTYYKHEPWEEYLTLIGNIELNSRRLVELSLANYTNTPNQTNPDILKNNLEKWQIDLLRIYPGREIALNCELANINYYLGLNYSWEKKSSFSAANATFTLDIASIGLTGYKFTAVVFLNLTIINQPIYADEKLTINITFNGEDKTPITGLKKDNFLLSGFNYTSFSVVAQYDETYMLIYTIECQGVTSAPSQVMIKVWDPRGIQVTAKYP